MKTFLFFLGGAITGVLTGILISPSSGQSNRNRLYYSVLNYLRPVEDIRRNTFQLEELSEHGVQKLSEAREAISKNDK